MKTFAVLRKDPIFYYVNSKNVYYRILHAVVRAPDAETVRERDGFGRPGYEVREVPDDCFLYVHNGRVYIRSHA